ncbi:MAG: ATP-binding protein [Elusimicrobiota bacterium]
MDELFEELTDGICVSDAEGNLLYHNPAAKRMLDAPEGAVSGKICDTLCKRFIGDTRNFPQACPLREAGSSQKAVSHLGRFPAKESASKFRDLRLRCVRMSTLLLDSWEIEKHFTIIEDATAEMELSRWQQDWQSMIAHDLRNPLTTIFATLRTLEELPLGHSLEATEKGLISISARSCRRMDQLLGLFLEVARLESGKMPVHQEIVPLGPLVRAACDEQALTFKEKGVRLEVSVADDAVAFADRALLARVLQNLLGNSLKFVPEKGSITIGLSEDRELVGLTIRDNGPGIPPEDIPFIFDRFYQAHGKGSRKAKGTGLGLTFCREAVRAMGGDIGVESALRFGTEFTIRLPRAT